MIASTSSRPLVRQALASASSSSASPASSSACRTFSTSTPLAAKPRRARNDDGMGLLDIPVFNYDDLPTLGHQMLNRQRELLRYVRIAHHEFPEMKAFQQPYNPSASQQILRFRHTHYQGVSHPLTRKSVLTVSVPDLFKAHSTAFSSVRAKRKFLHLAGPRWDAGGRGADLAEVFQLEGDKAYASKCPEVGEIKISCDRFPMQAQNDKWCSDVLEEMVAEAAREDAEGEDVASLPLDVRHRLVRDQRKEARGGGRGGRRRRATIEDWPEGWGTPKQGTGEVKMVEGAKKA